MQDRTMSGMGLIANRLMNLHAQYNHDRFKFFGSIIDLEDSVRTQSIVDYDPSVQIEEFADDNGYLINWQDITESVWLASIKRESRDHDPTGIGLDCRMIVNFQQPKELGLYRWTVLCCVDGKPVQYSVKVWIVPVPDDK
jgi:hypothetical protein